MKLHNKLIVLSLSLLLSSCSTYTLETITASSDTPMTNIDNKSSDEKEDDSQTKTEDSTEDEESIDNSNIDETPMEPNTFLIGGLDCGEIAGLYTLFHYPDTIEKESMSSLDVYLGHTWDGTRNFEGRTSDYLSCTYKLTQYFEKGKLSSDFKSTSNQIVRTEIAELSDFNTSAYDTKTNIRKGTITFNKYLTIELNKDMFDLSDEECGFLCFLIEVYDKDNNEVQLGVGIEYTRAYFIIEDGIIKFSSRVQNLIES